MEYHSVRCQVCLTKYKGISDYKKHLRSPLHRQKTQDVFPEETFDSSGVLTHISLMSPQNKHALEQHVIDLSVVTLCFTLGQQGVFYLCHVCEEKCPQGVILQHLLSADHCSNYISYTDPNMLSFSWLPCKNVKSILSPQDMGKRVPGHLQMLHLSLNLLTKLKSSTYSEGMQVLSEYSKFLKLIKATLPKRMTIETYQKDSKRKHPLLGMQHLVECICVGPSNKRHYLCTLCSLTVPAHMIIKHVLSFDHIFCYFKAWHPNTLLAKECYRDYTTAFASMMRCLSEQTQEIHGTESADMKQVIMEPAEFNSVNFTCYTEALKKLESIKKSSLTTTITPGNKLGDVGGDEDAKKPKGADTVSPSSFYQLRCQDCSTVFKRIWLFMKHLFGHPHQQNMKKYFNHGDGYDPTARVHLGIYSYIEHKKAIQPAVGVSLVVTIITTQAEVEPAYVCFACQDCFFESCLEQHFSSQKHLINTLLYQNPWRLPFAWEKDLNEAELRSMALEEQKERGANQMMVKVLDLPYSLFVSLNPLDYPTVMRTLTLQHTILKREVPACKTYSKLQDNERFPQLGKQFMIIYTDVPEPENEFVRARFLCLLCERKLLEEEFYGHVFSREHVEKFLNRFHPGSLNSSTDDANILLDLAKQAGRFHRILHVQAIQLDTPIWEPCSYRKTKSILAAVKRRRGKGKLEPPIKTHMKLVPRNTLKELNSGQQGGTVQQNGTNELCVENEQHIEKEEEMPTTNEKESQTAREVFGPGSEEKKNADGTCQVKKEETEELSVSKPSGEIPESGQNTDKEDGADAGIERGKSDENAPTELKNHTSKMSERKRPNSVSEASHEDTSYEDVGAEVDQKRMRLSSSADACCEEPSEMPNSEQKDEKMADMNETYKAAADKGLSTLLKCNCDSRDPIYLCESCTLRIPEKDVISHITSLDHQRMFLMVVELDEKDYSEISKLSHKSAIQRVKAIQALQDGRREPPSTSPSHGLKSEDTSEDHTEDMEIDEDPDSEAAAGMSVMTEITSKTAQVLSELKEVDTVTQIQVPLSADNSHTCLTVSSSGKEESSLCVTTRGTSTTCLAPENTNNDSCITPTVESLNMATTCEIEELTASISISTATTSACVAASPKMTVTTSASSVPVLMTTSTISAAVSALVKSKSDLASKVKATSQTGPSVVHEAPSCRIENHPKYSQSASKTTAPSQTVATSVEVTHQPETSVSASENTEASAKTVHVRNSVGATASVAPHIHKSSPPEAPHLTTDMSPLSEHKKQEATDTKPKEFPQKIGASQVIIVTCNGKRQVYCQLCSVRMQNSQHLMDIKHQQKYVLLRCPGWTAEPSEWESKLNNTVARLAQAEKRYKGSETIEVKSDVYKALSELPEDKAVEQLKTMVRQKSLLSTDSTAGQGLGVTSPCEVSSSDDGITMENPSADPPVTDSELVDIFAQIPLTFFQESTADTEQQSHSSHSEEHEPDLRSEPANPNALQTFPRILIGETTYGSNRLSWFLSVNKMDSEPVIGLRSVWECRGISLNPFYLCESCRKTLSLSEICKHLVSAYHHLHCMLRHYPQFMKWIEEEKDLLLEMKYELLNDIARMVSVRERFYKYEAQGIMLAPTSYERVRTAPFSEALKIVQKIKNEAKLTALYPPSSTAQQKNSHPKENPEESLPTETVQAPKTNQRSDKEVKQTSNLEETAIVGERRFLSPLDVNGSSSMAASVVSPFPNAATSLLSTQAQFTPQVKLKVKQAESPFPTVNTRISPRDESLSTRKPPAVTSAETGVRPCINDPLGDSLPAKCRGDTLQPINEPSSGSDTSEFTFVHPAVTTNPLSLEIKDPETESAKQNLSPAELKLLVHLISVVRKEGWNTPADKSAPVSAEMANSCAANSPDGEERKLDSESEKTECKPKMNNTRWDSQVFKTTKKEYLNSSNSFEGMFLTESSVHSNQHITPSANSPSLAISSSLEDSLIRGNPLCAVTAGEADGAIVPTSTEPSITLQNFPGNVSQPGSVCGATNRNPGQIQRSQGDTVTDGTGVHQRPINTIITARTHPVNGKLEGSYIEHVHTEVNRGHQVSFSTIQTANSSDTPASFEGFSQYSQVAHVPSVYSGCLPSDVAPNSQPVYSWNLNQYAASTATGLYSSQLYPQQGVNYYCLQTFGHSLAAPVPPECESLEMQQHQQQSFLWKGQDDQ